MESKIYQKVVNVLTLDLNMPDNIQCVVTHCIQARASWAKNKLQSRRVNVQRSICGYQLMSK